MVDQAVIDDMADYIIKLWKALDKKDFPLFLQTHILGIFIFHQFNGTRGDTKIQFDKIIKILEGKE